MLATDDAFGDECSSQSDDETCETPVCRPHVKADLEVADPLHRYSHNLRVYHRHWTELTGGTGDFWSWLALREIDLPECPRSVLDAQVVQYLSPQERRQYELVVQDGVVSNSQSERFSTGDGEWIFVISTELRLYCNRKLRGSFHHTSFLAAGPCCAAGGIEIDGGRVTVLYPHSGHYRPGEAHVRFVLDYLADRGVDLNAVACDAQRFYKVSRDHKPHKPAISPTRPPPPAASEDAERPPTPAADRAREQAPSPVGARAQAPSPTKEHTKEKKPKKDTVRLAVASEIRDLLRWKQRVSGLAGELRAHPNCLDRDNDSFGIRVNLRAGSPTRLGIAITKMDGVDLE